MGNGRGKVTTVTIKKPTGTDTNTTTTNKKTPTQPPVEPNVNPTNKKKGNRTGGDGVGGGGAPGGEGAPTAGAKGAEPQANPGTEKPVEPPKPKEGEGDGVKPHDPKKMYSGETNEGEINYKIQNNFINHLQSKVENSPYAGIWKYTYTDKDKEDIATFLQFAYKYNPKHASGEEVDKAFKAGGVEYYPKAYRPMTSKEESDLKAIYDKLNARERSKFMTDQEWARIQNSLAERKQKVFGADASIHSIQSFMNEIRNKLYTGYDFGDLEDTAKYYHKLTASALVAKFPDAYENLSTGDKRRLDFALAPHSKKSQEYKAKYDKELSKNPYFARNMALASDVVLDINKKLKGKAEIDGVAINFSKGGSSNGYTFPSPDYKGVVLSYENLQLGTKDALNPSLDSRGGSNKTDGYMKGWSTSYHGYLGTLLHETGHQVHFQLCFNDPDSAKKIAKFYGKSDYKATFSNKGKVAGGQSGYGSGYGSAEHFAECFAMYTTGAFPRTNKADYEKYRKLMKDLGLDHLEGAYSGKNLYKFHRGDATKTNSSSSDTGALNYTNNSSTKSTTKTSTARTTSTTKEPPKYKNNYKLPNGKEVKINPTEKDKARGYAIVPSGSPLYKYQVDLVTGKVTKYKPGMAPTAGSQKLKKNVMLKLR